MVVDIDFIKISLFHTNESAEVSPRFSSVTIGILFAVTVENTGLDHCRKRYLASVCWFRHGLATKLVDHNLKNMPICSRYKVLESAMFCRIRKASTSICLS